MRQGLKSFREENSEDWKKIGKNFRKKRKMQAQDGNATTKILTGRTFRKRIAIKIGFFLSKSLCVKEKNISLQKI